VTPGGASAGRSAHRSYLPRVDEIRRRVPGWALLAAAAVLVVVVVLGLLSSIYLGLAIVVVAVLAAGAILAWTRLPERFGEGPDKAERRELEQHRQEMEEQERERQEKEEQRRGEAGNG